MPPKITPEHLRQGRHADRRAHGRVPFRDYFDLDKARQALNADSPPLLTLLWDVEQRTLVIGECRRVEDLDAGVVVAGKCRCGTWTACMHGIVR